MKLATHVKDLQEQEDGQVTQLKAYTKHLENASAELRAENETLARGIAELDKRRNDQADGSAQVTKTVEGLKERLHEMSGALQKAERDKKSVLAAHNYQVIKSWKLTNCGLACRLEI